MTLILLILLGMVMTVCTFATSLLPFFIAAKSDYMNKITLTGAGLLIGTALGVIIPEGTVLIVKSSESVERIVALCLISGFSMMLLVEHITCLLSKNVSLSKNRNTMVGVLIHSMADGVALATVSFSQHASLEMIVFLAIIIHKLPAAFGLSCFLIGNGESRSQIKRFQLLFSISAVYCDFNKFSH
jgi:zinc transporter 9